ncbi:unnamed protein product (macronuclear) [Paramecium tetraurelia]|uniref:Uncharacterized protein n=1 Tax=Paramecium tetraurelia TaxID=5888 RepID=A0BBZ0_PARTE|nr:uncharacterized protein GSPATT00000493001 [Paramecium tetraurelia]CAK56057.1 unnamed protein product [Paramecium tetraurelia]|eukprot:XP_001423455.1 hypothetical protein (macronuclear) [Paramecium tetraurelia strain d4-2]
MQSTQNQEEQLQTDSASDPKKYEFKFGVHKNQVSLKLQQQLNVNGGDVFSLRYDQDDQYLAVGMSEGLIHLYNQNKLTHTLEQFQTPVTALRWRPNYGLKAKGILVSANAEGHVIHWHANSGKQLHKIVEENNSVLCLDFNFDGSLFATGGKDFCIRIYDDDIKSVQHQYQQADWGQRGHANRVFVVKFIPDQPNILISGGWDANILIWDIREKQCVGQFYGPSLSGDSLDFSVKRQLILTGSHRTENQVQLWDWRTRKLYQEILWTGTQSDDNRSYYIYATQFNKANEDYIYAGSSGVHEIKMFSLKDGLAKASILGLPKSILSIDQMNTTDSIVFSGMEGIVNIFKA